MIYDYIARQISSRPQQTRPKPRTMMVNGFGESSPFMAARFRLVKYYKLPRFQEPIHWRYIPYMFGLLFRPMGDIPAE